MFDSFKEKENETWMFDEGETDQKYWDYLQRNSPLIPIGPDAQPRSPVIPYEPLNPNWHELPQWGGSSPLS